MMVCPGIKFKTIEGNSLATNRDFCQILADITVKQIGAHAQVPGSIRTSVKSCQHIFSIFDDWNLIHSVAKSHKIIAPLVSDSPVNKYN